jgi:hypothetical protein
VIRFLIYLLVPIVFLAWVSAIAIALSSSNCFDTAVLAWIVLVVTPVACGATYVAVTTWHDYRERKRHGKI